MAELNEWSEWANKRQQKVFERSEVDTMFLDHAERQQHRDMRLTRGLESIDIKLNGLIKENEVLAEQIKTLQSELKHINSPLNKLFVWICKITKK